MSTPDISRPVDRYGKDFTPEKPKGMTGKVIAVLMVVAVAIILVAGMSRIMTKDDSPIEGSFVTSERIDDQTNRVWIDVVRTNTEIPSYCIATSLDYSMAEVGRREVIIPAGGEAQMRIAVDMPTRAYPVSGGIYGCSENVPSYMNTENPTYDQARS
ncbi:DUF4307 domain-containing protein [Corynebacterium sp. S7]